MMTTVRRLFLVLLLCMPALAQAQMTPPVVGQYVVFIHCGPLKADDAVVRQLALRLAKEGYSVRVPEEDQDKVGGPGVDYFADSAKVAAEAVASSVNAFFASQVGAPPTKKLATRLQIVKGTATYLGVWLF